MLVNVGAVELERVGAVLGRIAVELRRECFADGVRGTVSDGPTISDKTTSRTRRRQSRRKSSVDHPRTATHHPSSQGATKWIATCPLPEVISLYCASDLMLVTGILKIYRRLRVEFGERGRLREVRRRVSRGRQEEGRMLMGLQVIHASPNQTLASGREAWARRRQRLRRPLGSIDRPRAERTLKSQVFPLEDLAHPLHRSCSG